MIDYATLKLIWWGAIGLVFVMYGTTAGSDLGITNILPFLPTELDRRLALNISGRTWDGNQSWIVFGGGGLFFAWPLVYSVAFSCMYLLLFLIVAGFFLRPTGYDYRKLIESPRWRRFWDWALMVSSALPVFIFGVILGNSFQGIAFRFDEFGQRVFFDGQFADFFNFFAIFCGLIVVVTVTCHGASYLFRRSEGHLKHISQLIHRYGMWLLVCMLPFLAYELLFVIHGYQLLHQGSDSHTLRHIVISTTGYYNQVIQEPWKLIPAILLLFAIATSLVANYIDASELCFWSSVAIVTLFISQVGFLMFPFILPSSVQISSSITLWNAVSSQKTLNLMLYVAACLLPIIFIYRIVAYSVFWSKKHSLTEQDLIDSHDNY